MFIADCLVGNFDRHNGNWGFLINESLKKIGIAKSIGWLILLMIVGFIITLVGAGISVINPVAGSIIASFIVMSYFYLFYYRCVGLLYSNI